MKWLALSPAKLAITFDHVLFSVEYLREERPAAIGFNMAHSQDRPSAPAPWLRTIDYAAPR